MWNSLKNALHLLLMVTCVSSKIAATDRWTNKQQVCIIGAGAAGLSSAKQLAEYPDEFDIVVFERNAEVGGTWLYSELTDVDEHYLPVYSSMYKNLRTNLPKEIMIFPDYLRFFDPEDRSCVSHETVLSYLKNYTEYYNLRQYIQFNTFVEKVTPIPIDDDWRNTKFVIKSTNLNTYQTSNTTCDAVVVCNGHYFNPNIPNIPGIENFPGTVIHSHSYRHPEMFQDQTVALLGASYSGIDIALEIAKHAKRVYLSHNKEPIKGSPPGNIIQVPGVVAANFNELILDDGSSFLADAFILCTGYNYAFPFLDDDSCIEIDDNHIVPIYKNLLNVRHPKMSFVGLPLMAINFPIIYAQAKYTVALLRGQVQLPSVTEMMLNTTVPEGTRKRNAHGLGTKQWEYANELASEAGFEPLPLWYQKATNDWLALRTTDPWYYKQNNLYISKDGDVTILNPAERALYFANSPYATDTSYPYNTDVFNGYYPQIPVYAY